MDDLKWMAAVLMMMFGGLFGGLAFSEYRQGELQMECIKQRGEWIGKTCVFREHKAAQ